MNRPQHLPDYSFPPLNEVAMGIQFAPPKGYQQILAGEVRDLFRLNYPKAKEVQPLPPSFETFGQPQRFGGFELSMVSIVHNRYWFLSPNEDELIQFQSDRLLHNWRKVDGENNTYPRFENMIMKFEKELRVFEEYIVKLPQSTLDINQCELSYINHVHYTDVNGPGKSVDDWINILNFQMINTESFALKFSEQILDSIGKPCGRLICEIVSILNQKHEPVISLNITVRGEPETPNIAAALNFITKGRESIVLCFDKITSEFAHQQWGKK